ncbi:MAG: hypothetical protein M3123_04460 [Actinomycetota bacterium]|nr:hypothetical protein [Actinomycetota bacterium]
MVPKQTLISVEISDGETASVGVASLTYYVEPGDAAHDPRLDASLSEWLGASVWGRNSGSTEGSNPYDPAAKPLRAAVELAALDALGRETRLPVAAFLGGLSRTRVEAYASLPSFGRPEDAVACAGAAVGSGFRAVKFHASGSVEADVETIVSARRELGSAIGLMWDASCAYELYSAVLIGNALAEADFLWFEAPLADDSTESLRSLAGRISVPLVPDGLVQRSAADWARDVRDGVWGALRLDVTRTPGISSALRLLRVAETLGLPCEIQSFGFPVSQYSNLQLMLTTHACRFFEAPFPPSDFEDGIANAPALRDGFVAAPDALGLGHDVSLEKLAESCRELVTLSL